MIERIFDLFIGVKIWLWWKIILRSNEFHPRLSFFRERNMKVLGLKREIAHLLDAGCSSFNPLIISLWKRIKKYG